MGRLVPATQANAVKGPVAPWFSLLGWADTAGWEGGYDHLLLHLIYAAWALRSNNLVFKQRNLEPVSSPSSAAVRKLSACQCRPLPSELTKELSPLERGPGHSRASKWQTSLNLCKGSRCFPSQRLPLWGHTRLKN